MATKEASRTRSKAYVETLIDAHALIPKDAVVIGTPLVEMQTLLKHGQEMTVIDVHRSLFLRERHDLQNKECFFNAQLLAFIYDSLTYCEGIGSSVIATEHAWLIDTDGRVVDPTWVKPSDRHTHRMIDYFGIKVPTKDLTRIWKHNRERAMPVLRDYFKTRSRRHQ